MMEDRLFHITSNPETLPHIPEELPLPVVPDWDEQARAARLVCQLIDRHLDHEASCRNLWRRTEMQPVDLCPEQRVQMVTDVYGMTR